jgi:ABC-type transport system substrate-binding protein
MPRAAQVLLALVLGSSFASCGLTDGSSAEGESRTLRVLYESDERSLYPAMEDVPRFLVFHPLVRYRSLPDAFCWRNPEPALAARWTPTDGFRTWMIELREDARWHDGEPFTAHDMAFTVELGKHPDVQHWAAAKIDSVSVLGERTVRIFFDRPSRNPLNAWDIWYPKHLLQDFDPAEFWEWEFWRTPVGNGPFRFVTAVSGERAELEAHPLPGPRERRIQRVVLNWGGSALGQLKAGAVDAASLEPSDAAVLRDDPAFVLRFQASAAFGAPSPWRSTGGSCTGPSSCPPTCRSPTLFTRPANSRLGISRSLYRTIRTRRRSCWTAPAGATGMATASVNEPARTSPSSCWHRRVGSELLAR